MKIIAQQRSSIFRDVTKEDEIEEEQEHQQQQQLEKKRKFEEDKYSNEQTSIIKSVCSLKFEKKYLIYILKIL